jgi:hypothetical protein
MTKNKFSAFLPEIRVKSKKDKEKAGLSNLLRR